MDWGGYSGLRHLWFITAIFLCYLTTPVLQALRRVSPVLMIVLLGYGALELTFLQYDLEQFVPLFIYALGYLIPNVDKAMRRVISAAFTIAAIIIVCHIQWVQITDMENFWSRLFHVFVGVSFSMLFIGTVSRFKRLALPKAIHLLDRYSYPIYLVHHPLILGPLTLMTLTAKTSINIVIITALTFVLAFLQEKISNKVNAIV